MPRFEILKFMLSCEELLSFVDSKGGPVGLTTEDEERRTIYERILSARVPDQQEHYEQKEHQSSWQT